MEIESVVISISGSLIVILLSVIGYFLKQLVGKIDNLTTSINKLTVITSVQEEDIENIIDKVKEMKLRIDAHTVSINAMDKEITEIKTKCKYKHEK